MAEISCPYLVEESLGKQWHFTLSPDHKVQYACREHGAWTDPAPIDGQSVKFFRAAIDKRDRIHLLAYTLTKQLMYYEWDGDQWYQRMLYRITSRFENISYLEVLSTADSIHLLYYIENSLKRAQESFIHSYLENGSWKSDVLMNFLTDQIVVPQLACSDEKGNLYCIYTKTLRNQAHCYLVRFDSRNAFWSKPSILFQKPVKCSSFNCFVDSTGMMHMVWQEEANGKFSLYYKKVDTEALNFSSVDACLHEADDPMQYPCIVSGNGSHCSWIQGGKVMASHADQKGNHWDAPREITDQPVQPHLHVHKTLDGRSITALELGDGSPGFEWTVRKLLTGGQEIPEKQQKDVRAGASERRSSQKAYQPENSALQELRELNEKVDQAAARMDEFYTALYQLQDYIRQKDKSFFQIDAQIRKMSFEIEQLRIARSSGRPRASGYAPVHSDEDKVNNGNGNDDYTGRKGSVRSPSGQNISSRKAKAEGAPISEEDDDSMTDDSRTDDIKANKDFSRNANNASDEPAGRSDNSVSDEDVVRKVKGVSGVDAITKADFGRESEILHDADGHDHADAGPMNENSGTRGSLLKNMDHGSGEIQLGNVSILINPEEEA